MGIAWELNSIPILGGIFQPWLPMADPDAIIGEYTFATLSTNVEGLFYKLGIAVVGIPKGCSCPGMGIVKFVAKGL